MTPDTSWTSSQAPAGPSTVNRAPSLAIIGETPHLVWESGGILIHSHCDEGGWSPPVRIAMGSEPTLGVTSNGDLHCLFTNLFAGNSEVYHAVCSGGSWSLPHNISRTSGDSSHPMLAIDSGDVLHAAWADTTPGYPIIYYAELGADRWNNTPIPNARGHNPVIAVGPAGAPCVAWEDRTEAESATQILCTQRVGEWQLPNVISDSRAALCIEPGLCVDAQGVAHVVWQEQCDGVFRLHGCRRVPGAWTAPTPLSVPRADCVSPRISTGPHGILELVWLEANVVYHRSCQPQEQPYWLDPEPAVAANAGGPTIVDLALAVSRSGSIHLAWSTLSGTDCRVFYANRAPTLAHAIHMPLISR